MSTVEMTQMLFLLRFLLLVVVEIVVGLFYFWFSDSIHQQRL